MVSMGKRRRRRDGRSLSESACPCPPGASFPLHAVRVRGVAKRDGFVHVTFEVLPGLGAEVVRTYLVATDAPERVRLLEDWSHAGTTLLLLAGSDGESAILAPDGVDSGLRVLPFSA